MLNLEDIQDIDGIMNHLNIISEEGKSEKENKEINLRIFRILATNDSGTTYAYWNYIRCCVRMVSKCIIGELKKDREKNIEQMKFKNSDTFKSVDFAKEGKFILCSKCLDNTPHEPAFGICQRCGTKYTNDFKK